MPSPLTLPIVAGLSIIGGLGGVWLGHSAIDQVNPYFFGQPETRFHADSVPYRSPDWEQVRALEEARNAGSEIISCIGCRNWPQEYRPIRDAAFARFEGGADGWSAGTASLDTREPEPAVAVASEPDPEWQRVRAYSSYPVDYRERRTEADKLNDETMAAAQDEALDVEEGSGTE
jgi:hypothetical protein